MNGFSALLSQLTHRWLRHIVGWALAQQIPAQTGYSCLLGQGPTYDRCAIESVENKLLYFNWLFLLLGIAVLARTMPHFPNVAPFTALAIVLGMHCQSNRAVGLIITTYLLSNACLALIDDIPFWGDWLLFTLTGLVAIVYCTKCFKAWTFFPRLWIGTTSMTLLYWVWTNWGVWLTSQLYPLNGPGLFACYTFALPFLTAAWAGDMAWVLIFELGFCFIQDNRTTTVGSYP